MIILGNKVTKFFMYGFALGVISLAVAMFGIFPEWSPYRFGHLGGGFFLIQLSSGVVMIYSGVFGLMISNTTEINAHEYNTKLAWGIFLFLAVLYASVVWVGFYLMPSELDQEPVFIDWLAIVFGTATIVATAFFYVMTCRYILRVQRLAQPMKDLIG